MVQARRRTLDRRVSLNARAMFGATLQTCNFNDLQW